MSARNGGRGRPPVPPEGHGPKQEIRVGRTIIENHMGIEVDRAGEGMVLSFLVTEGGEVVRRTYQIGKPGRERIRDAATGGVKVAGADEMPGAGT